MVTFEKSSTRKYAFSIVAYLMVAVMAIYFVVCNVDFGASTTQAVTRTVEIGQMLDEQSVLNEYEDVTVQTEGLKTEFTGYRSIDPSLFDEIDNANQSDEKQSECRVLYR